MTSNTTPTELIHLTYDGNFVLECDAKVLCCKVIDDNAVEVELDRTTMHPQGGGQPTDIGTLVAGDNKTVEITKVMVDRETGIVTHKGKQVNGGEALKVGDEVKVSVDKDTRQILSECHTAGHVVDSAMARCDQVLPARYVRENALFLLFRSVLYFYHAPIATVKDIIFLMGHM